MHKLGVGGGEYPPQQKVCGGQETLVLGQGFSPPIISWAGASTLLSTLNVYAPQSPMSITPTVVPLPKATRRV